MIYLCADDYGLCADATANIERCIDAGALNQVSVFPNLDEIDLHKLLETKNIRLVLHVNLVEGPCMADEVNLLADENGNFKHTFFGLFVRGLFGGKQLEAQAYREIKAQVLFWKSRLPEGVPFCIDTHQHTHMIPAVWRALLKVLYDENIRVTHLRVPAEPILPYLATPSLYFTYRPVNLAKQWLFKLLWQVNRKHAKQYQIPTSHFFGLLFSGKMDEKRVKKLLPKYQKLANKDGRDIEVLFHPGYIDGSNPDFENKNIVFSRFYFSKHRKTEFDYVMKLTEGSVL